MPFDRGQLSPDDPGFRPEVLLMNQGRLLNDDTLVECPCCNEVVPVGELVKLRSYLGCLDCQRREMAWWAANDALPEFDGIWPLTAT